jgi:hypothetical protein
VSEPPQNPKVTQRIDLRDLIADMCERFHVEPRDVLQITLKPSSATLLIAKRNDDGNKYVDAETNTVATREQTWRIRS